MSSRKTKHGGGGAGRRAKRSEAVGVGEAFEQASEQERPKQSISFSFSLIARANNKRVLTHYSPKSILNLLAQIRYLKLLGLDCCQELRQRRRSKSDALGLPGRFYAPSSSRSFFSDGAGLVAVRFGSLLGGSGASKPHIPPGWIWQTSSPTSHQGFQRAL